MRKNSRRVTIQDVANKAGVALMTVSRVINTPHSVTEKTRKHVESVMSGLGYVKNNIASCLASSKEIFCFVLVDLALRNIDTIKYMRVISERGMIPCFLCFENKDDLLVNIIKARSFSRPYMFVLFSQKSEPMVRDTLIEENIINLADELKD